MAARIDEHVLAVDHLAAMSYEPARSEMSWMALARSSAVPMP